MLIVPLILLQIIIFTSLVFFLRKILNRNVIAATAHLEQLASEYAKKEEEIKKLFEQAKRQSQEILANAQKDAQQQKEQILKEAQGEKDKILIDVHQKAEEMIQQADRARQALIQEIEQRIDEKATQRAAQLLQQALPEHIREGIHQRWFDDLISSSFAQIDRLHIPEGVCEARVVTAFALTPQQRDALDAKIKERLGFQINLKEEIDSNLIAGLIVNIGSLVLDGSLKFKIQEVAIAK